MSNTIASLGIAVTSDGVSKAVSDLDRLVDAGRGAENVAKSTGSAWTRAAGDISRDTQLIVRELQALNAKQDNAARLMATVGTAVTSAAASFTSAAASITSYQARTEALNATQQRSAESAQKAGSAARKQADDLAALLGRIDPTVAALGRLDELEKKLAQQKRIGALDAETFAQYQAKIDQSRAALTRFDDSLTRTGNTARQNAAALRGVPAQFTDIFTSLQGGQAPLTVLLQQGGQLKDMFGGIGPAAKALGGYVAGLVNPFTVAAAAAAVLSYAYIKGASEAIEYQKAIVLSGNAAGTSAAQLSGLAQSISSTVGSVGEAGAILVKLTQSGKVASGAFEEIAKAALEMQNATGKAASETVAEFVKIGKDPVAAAKDLNDQYNFLTQSVYEQIVALKSQGDTIGATRLLTDTYAETVRSRAQEITNNLGLIERGWLAVKTAAKGALDATLSVGREQTLDQQAAAIKARLADPSAYSSLPIFGADNPNMASAGRSRDQDEAQLRYINLQIEAEKTRTKYVADRVAAENAAIDATVKIKAINDANLTVEEKRKKEIKEYLAIVARIKEANPASELVSADAVAKGIQNIKDKNKDPAAKSAGAVDLTDFNDQKNALAAIVGEYNNAEKELDASRKAGLLSQQKYSDQKLLLLKTENEETQAVYAEEIKALEGIRDRSTTTAAQRIQVNQKIADAQAAATKAAKDNASQQAVVATEAEGARAKEIVSIQKYVDALGLQNEALRKSGERAVADIGKSSRQKGLSSSLNAEDDKFASASKTLADQQSDASRAMSDTEYTAKIDALRKSHDEATQQILKNYDDITAGNENWLKGAKSAFAEYNDSAQDVAGQTKDLVGGTLETLTTGFSDSLAGAIVSADSLGDALSKVGRTAASQVLSSFIEIGTRIAVNDALELAGIATKTSAKVGAAVTVATAETAAIGATAAASVAATTATTATQTAAAATTTAAWTPAAIVSSIGSFGAAAAIGLAAVVAALAFKGFKTGGYTGSGGTSEVAGVVHGQEYVFDAQSTARIGKGTLDAMRSGNMQASANASSYAGAPAQGIKGNTYVTFKEDASKAGTASTTQQDGDTYITGFVSNIAQQGDAATMLESTYGLTRRGR